MKSKVLDDPGLLEASLAEAPLDAGSVAPGELVLTERLQGLDMAGIARMCLREAGLEGVEHAGQMGKRARDTLSVSLLVDTHPCNTRAGARAAAV